MAHGSVVPSNTEPWPVGASFYGYDEMLDAVNLGYRGPAFSYARIPDQYTWQHFYERELARPHDPVMAEIDFVSSHTPWTPLPRWCRGTRSATARCSTRSPAEGPSPVDVWSDAHGCGRCTAQSVAVHARRDVLVP